MPLTPLAGSEERWFTREPVTRFTVGAFQGCQSGDLLALACWRETTPARIARDTGYLYREALAAIATAGFPHPVRIWNYLPDITAGSGDQESYRQFCAGRADALRLLGIPAESLPAASALGSAPGMPLQLVVLASRRPGRNLENPRQQSAYAYPRQYGADSPAFARATLWGRHLLISGTAAIVGHESQCPDDLDGQLRCTVDNLLLLLDHACAEADVRRVRTLHARVYLRHPEHLERVRDLLPRDLPALTSAIYLHAAICRRDLLLEIEAAATLA